MPLRIGADCHTLVNWKCLEPGGNGDLVPLHEDVSGGRLRRDSVSVPLSGSSAGWVQSVPLPDLTQGGLSPDRGEARQRRRKFMLPQPAADCHSKNTPASVRQDLNAAALYCRS